MLPALVKQIKAKTDEGKLPCIDRIPEPLAATTNRNPIKRKFKLSCSFFSSQWSKLPEMLVP